MQNGEKEKKDDLWSMKDETAAYTCCSVYWVSHTGNDLRQEPDVCNNADHRSISTASVVRNAGLITAPLLTLHVPRRSGDGILARSPSNFSP
jgi:hypothetical protein